MKYRIGVDSGGTHVVATSYTLHNKEIKTVTEGIGNIFFNPEETVKNIIIAVSKIANSDDNCVSILIGIAGLSSSPDPDKYLKLIRNKLSEICKKIFFINDAKLALLNCLEGKDGFLAIAGTGSIVYGKQNNKILRAGGWGYILDDACSGYAIVKEAVQQAIAAYDRGEQSILAPQLLKFFSVKTIPQLVTEYYHLSRSEIATFSKTLYDNFTTDNSTVIEEIFIDQASLLSREIINLIKRYSNKNLEYKLALSGSVLTHNKIIQRQITENIRAEYPKMKIITTFRNNNAAVNYFK